MNANEAPDIANLLEHSAWLRRLAGHLVFEREDSVQDVWVAALRTPPDADRPPQPWLSRVLKNAARRRHRDALVRRDNEERAAATIQDVPTPEELVARMETQRLLAELVLGLSEPFRRAVLLRYYEGLSGAEIARALGVPAGTVRWQIKEGIDRLRSALDSRFGNDRHTWMLAFASLAAVPRGSSMMGVGLMTAKMKIAAILVPLLSLALVGIAWRAGVPAANRSRERAAPTSPTSSNLSRPIAASNQSPAADTALPAVTSNTAQRQARLEARVQELEAELRRTRDATDQVGGQPLREPAYLPDRFKQAALVRAMNSALQTVVPGLGITSIDCSEYPCIVYASGNGRTVDQAKQLKDAQSLQVYFRELDHSTIGLTGDGPNDLLYFYAMPAADSNSADDIEKRISGRIIDMAIANGAGVLTGRHSGEAKP